MAAVEQGPEVQQQQQEMKQTKGRLLVGEKFRALSTRLVVGRQRKDR